MDNRQPLYDWLVNELKGRIDQLIYKPHNKMPSERELSIIYHVSRTTVRSALKQLEIEGYIYKQQGKGTFVSQESDRMMNLSKMYSFTEQMLLLNKEPKTIILKFEEILPTDNIARQMGLLEKEKVYSITRLRLADNEPMMVEVTYMPVHLFKGLTHQSVANKSLYAIVSEEYGEIISLAQEKFLVGIATLEDAKHLDIEQNAPVFQIQRQTYNAKKNMIELTNSIARGDKFIYQINHRRMINNMSNH